MTSTLLIAFSKLIPISHVSHLKSHISKHKSVRIVTTLSKAQILLFRYEDDDSHGELQEAYENDVKVLPLGFLEWGMQSEDGTALRDLLLDEEEFRRWALWGDAMGPAEGEKSNVTISASFERLLKSVNLFGAIHDSAREREELPHTVPDFVAQTDKLVPTNERDTIYVLYLEREREADQHGAPLPKQQINQFMEAFFHGMEVKEHPSAHDYSLMELAAPKQRTQHGVCDKSRELFHPVATRQDKLKCRDESSGRWRAQRITRLQVMDLLAIFEERLPGDAFALLVITPEDIFEEDSAEDSTTGRATGDGVAVISTYRFNPLQNASIDMKHLSTPQDIARLMCSEFLKTLAHECCHIFGIDHCIFSRCLMNACLVEVISQNSFHLCPVDLRKLHLSIGFNVKERYEALGRFYQEQGMSNEDELVGKLLNVLNGDASNADN